METTTSTPSVPSLTVAVVPAIMISNTIRIVSSDDKNWTIEEASIIGEKVTTKGRKPLAENIGKKVWRFVGYYASLEQALRACLDQRLRDLVTQAGTVQVEEALKLILQAKAEFSSLANNLRSQLDTVRQ